MDVSRKLDSSRKAAQGVSMPTDLGTCAIALVKATSKGAQELVAPYNLSLLHFTVLRRFLHKDKWTSTELTQLIPVGPSRMSRLVAELVSRKLLRRRRLRSDRRVVMLSLTEEGKAFTVDLNRLMSVYEASLTKGVSEEAMAAFLNVTHTILFNEAAQAQTGAPLNTPDVLTTLLE